MHAKAPSCVLSTLHQSLLTGSTTVGCSGDYYPSTPQWGLGCQHMNPEGQIKPFPAAVSGNGSGCLSWGSLIFSYASFLDICCCFVCEARHGTRDLGCTRQVLDY